MRIWYKFLILDKFIKKLDNRFLFTNYQLIENNINPKKFFKLKNLKKNKIFFKQYEFLRNNLDPSKETLFIGSSWGESEFFLKDKYKIIASDSEYKYVRFHKNNTNLNYIKLNILNLKKKNKTYEQIVVNNIEYLFNNNQLKQSIKNIYKISKPRAIIFVIFRSRDGFLTKIIDQFLTYIETYLVYLFLRIYKKIIFFKAHQGFRRSLKEFKKIWVENNFEYINIYEDLYEIDYNRLRIVQRLKISFFLSRIFLKLNPYLNILTFKKSTKKKYETNNRLEDKLNYC
jgi:hypothetical protein